MVTVVPAQDFWASNPDVGAGRNCQEKFCQGIWRWSAIIMEEPEPLALHFARLTRLRQKVMSGRQLRYPQGNCFTKPRISWRLDEINSRILEEFSGAIGRTGIDREQIIGSP
jgi:hypothetical protein